MLVLSRRERQRIKLGDSIIVTVVRVSGDKVRLGIEAPADILVLRDELEPLAAPAAAKAAQVANPATADAADHMIADATANSIADVATPGAAVAGATVSGATMMLEITPDAIRVAPAA